MKIRPFTNGILLLLLLSMIVILGSIALGTLSTPQQILAFSPERFISEAIYLTRLDTETGVNQQSGYTISHADDVSLRFVDTLDTALCRITLAQHNPSTEEVTIHAYDAIEDTWQSASLQLRNTNRSDFVFPPSLWSPDGRWLYFNQNGQSFLFDIQTQASYPLENIWGRVLEWSPDSRYFLTYTNSPPYDLIIFDTHTAIAQRIPIETLRFATWSPDSTRILIVEGWIGTQPQINLIDLETFTKSSLTTFHYFDGTFGSDKIVWSPDARHIFIVAQHEERPLTDMVVFTYAVDTETGTAQQLPASEMYWRVPWEPIPSPDGRFVTYMASADDFVGATTIRIYDTIRQELREIPHINVRSGTSILPVWSTDSQYLLLTDMQQNLVLLNVESRELRIVDRLPRRILGWLDDGNSFAYTTEEVGTIFIARLSDDDLIYHSYELEGLTYPIAQIC